jgi:lipoyl(octanoyl) transferase
MEYQRAWDLQVDLAAKVHDGAQPNTLLLLEHPPVYTKGRLSKPEDILLSDEELRQKGIGIHEVDRGGQVTFHGPGQLVAYPVVDLREWGGPVKYVRTLERIIVDTLADFKITSESMEGITGVWVAGAKIAAIGVKISRGIAYHGFAINVTTDLSYYSHIVPCGISDRPVTSMAEVLGADVEMGMAQYSLAYQFGKGMGFGMVEAEEEALGIKCLEKSQPQQVFFTPTGSS